MGKAKRPKPQFSETVSSFISAMKEAVLNYDWCSDEVVRADRLTQDYLHKLELQELDYKERARVATQLAKCRQHRRDCKDTTEVLQPLVDFLLSEKGKNLMNNMNEVLGKTRKVERIMENRAYIFRVLDEGEIKP